MSEHEGHRARLRERYAQTGFDGFADHEVLELLLTYCIPRRDTNPLAHRLIERFGSLHGVMCADQEELKRVDGMGENSAAFVSMLLPLLRKVELNGEDERLLLDTYGKLKEYCRKLFIGEKQEVLYLICLDPSLHLIRPVLLSRGTVDGIAATARLVAGEAMKWNASGAVLTHNHPSGNPSPSQEDIRFTEDVRRALNALDITLHDHIIVGRTTLSLTEAQRSAEEEP